MGDQQPWASSTVAPGVGSRCSAPRLPGVSSSGSRCPSSGPSVSYAGSQCPSSGPGNRTVNIKVHWTHPHTHTLGHTCTATRENCYCRGGLATGSTRVFFLFSDVYYFIFIYSVISLFLFPAVPTLGNNDNSPSPGERHAFSTVLSCRHSREVTIPVACLSKEYLAQLPYERQQRPRSPTHTLPYRPAPSYFIHKNGGLWQFWTAVWVTGSKQRSSRLTFFW